MKRNLLLAISVFALSAASQPLFAAEAETPAPRERAAPAAERAPARERAARPAPQRAAPVQQAAQAAPSNSFTGSQVGGFGGGNVGGGGFADPVCLNSVGGLSNGCTPVRFTHSLSKTGGVGGLTYEYKWALSPYAVIGVFSDLAFGRTNASGALTVAYASDPFFFPTQTTIENYTNSFSQSTNGSVRLKMGVVPAWYSNSLIYFTAGLVVSRLQGTFTYAATNFASGCAPFSPICATNASSYVNWSQTRTGFAGGVGWEFRVPAVGPGVIVTLDYTLNAFGSLSQNFPVVTNTACVASATHTCGAVDNASFSNITFHKFTLGAKIPLQFY